MKDALSKIVFVLSWVSVALAVLVGWFWYAIVLDQDGRGSLGFRYLITPVFGGGCLVLAMASGIFYSRQRQPRDLWSLILSGLSCVSVVGEALSLFFVPLHGPW